MSLKWNGQTHTLYGFQASSPTIISSHRMENLLKKGHHGVISQFNDIQAIESNPSNIHPYLQNVLSHHQHLFEKPMKLPPSRAKNDHSIYLILGSHPPNVQPYRYSFSQNNEIGNIIKELLEVGVTNLALIHL